MNQVFSPFQPDTAEGGLPPEGTSAPAQPATLLSQRLGHLHLKLGTAGTEPNFPSMPGEIEELQAQLQQARQGLVEWARAEVGWKGQRRLFKIMTENMADLIAVADSEGNRVWNNRAYSQLLGYSAEHLADTHLFAEVASEDRTRVGEAFTQAVQGTTIQQIEFRAQQKDGGWVDLQAKLVPIGNPEGKVDTVVFIAHDATEKKKLVEALALASTGSAAAGVMEGMARDLGEVLTSITGNLAIAKSLNPAPNTLTVRLVEIEHGLQRARDILGQIDSMSGRPDHPHVHAVLEPVVQEAVNAVLRGTMVRAEYLFPRRLPEVDLDVESFSHALRNIITNSVQAMDKGVVRVSAEFLSQEHMARAPHLPLKHGSYIHLTIQDQGHGMTERTLAHAFEPYFTTRPGAQGLGLTTALSAIQRLGGTVTADSTPGVGTSIHVYLPAVPLEPSQASRLATSALPSITVKKRILLMDDEQMILDIVSRMLSHLGYEVKTCSDGAQAIAAFTKARNQGEPFDVVLMDLVIPNGLGGQDAVHTLRKIDPHVKVVASSGHLDHPVMMEHKKFGFMAALEKPYKLERLQQVIESVIDSAS